MTRIHSCVFGMLLATVFCTAGMGADSPYDIPRVERGPDPASQTIGRKSCGTTWIPYNMRCDLTSPSTGNARAQAPAVTAPSKSRFDKYGNFLQDCEQYPPVELNLAKMEAREPSKEALASYQPWLDIQKGQRRRWFCHLGSLDDYFLSTRANDQCAQNSHLHCILSWRNRFDGRGYVPNVLTRPVAVALDEFVKVQRELKLPEVMIVRESDCSGALAHEYLQAFGRQSSEGVRMDTPRWVECAMEGRAQSWRGVSQAVEVREVPCGKAAAYKGLVCETYTVSVDGKKQVFPGVRAPFAAARDFSQNGYAMLLRELGLCDSRIADSAFSEVGKPKGRQRWTRKHLEMLREHCAVAAVAFENPDVTAWARSIVVKYDAAIADTPNSARIEQ